MSWRSRYIEMVFHRCVTGNDFPNVLSVQRFSDTPATKKNYNHLAHKATQKQIQFRTQIVPSH